MRNRKLVIGLIVLLLLALGLVWLMGALRPPTPQFEPLTLERKNGAPCLILIYKRGAVEQVCVKV